LPSPTPITTITVSVSPTQIHEGGEATFTISSSAKLSTPITVHYWMGGKAQQGIDYTLNGLRGQVVIPAGESFARVVLDAIIDNTNEKDERAGMHLTSGPGYVVAKSAVARVVILRSP
jgi:hypothetical protein